MSGDVGSGSVPDTTPEDDPELVDEELEVEEGSDAKAWLAGIVNNNVPARTAA
jgi:hypothetical protein